MQEQTTSKSLHLEIEVGTEGLFMLQEYHRCYLTLHFLLRFAQPITDRIVMSYA